MKKDTDRETERGRGSIERGKKGKRSAIWLVQKTRVSRLSEREGGKGERDKQRGRERGREREGEKARERSRRRKEIWC